MGARNTLIQNNYEINVGHDSLGVDFLGANKQFHWIELSLEQDKSNKCNSIYDSYNVEMVSKRRKSVRLTSFTETYNLTNKKNITLTI